MTPHWDYYFCHLHGRLAAIYVDLAYGPLAPVGGLATLVWVVAELRDPQPDGLASQAETPELAAFEKVLVPELTKRLTAAYVARATTQGRREFYFYARDPHGLEAAFEAVLELAPAGARARRYEHGTRADPEWSHFRDVLFPAPLELQLMHNRHVLADLQKQGDDGTRARQVMHWLWFREWRPRAAMAEWARTRGFVAMEPPPVADPAKQLPFPLQLVHQIPLELPGVNSIVSDLFEQAEQHGGDYDGWEISNPVPNPASS